jgi:hypothetical protein
MAQNPKQLADETQEYGRAMLEATPLMRGARGMEYIGGKVEDAYDWAKKKVKAGDADIKERVSAGADALYNTVAPYLIPKPEPTDVVLPNDSFMLRGTNKSVIGENVRQLIKRGFPEAQAIQLAVQKAKGPLPPYKPVKGAK